VLEVAPGPGFLAIEMARSGKLHVTGLDISKTFVELARKNAAQAGVRVDFRAGNASEMPFAENSFDLLVCRAAFKNFSEPQKALREMRRVLRPGGTGVIIDLRRDTPMTEIQRYIDHMGLNAWNRWVTTLTFRFMLLKRAYTKPELEKMLEGIGFAKAEVRTDEIGMEAWFEK
jgi:ubiquinone/menaquinone biosynthesis C-methylase UbiE